MKAWHALFALALATGCEGADVEGLCEDREACQGGNDADVEACVAQGEMLEDAADTEGCSEEYEAVVDCFLSESTCREEITDYGCATDADCLSLDAARCATGFCQRTIFGPTGDACAAEANAYERCM